MWWVCGYLIWILTCLMEIGREMGELLEIADTGARKDGSKVAILLKP